MPYVLYSTTSCSFSACVQCDPSRKSRRRAPTSTLTSHARMGLIIRQYRVRAADTVSYTG
eukprot:425046-Pleurochrysis_carterae.AAC.3